MLVVSIKKKTVKDQEFYYAVQSISYKGEKKRFEKYIGPVDMPEEEKERKTQLYSYLLQMKAELYKVVMMTKQTELQHLNTKCAFFLNFVSTYYEKYLSVLYPAELEKYQQEFDVRYVHNTNAIEGNTLTLMEAGLVFEGISPKNKQLREIHEVENYKRMLKYVREYKGDLSPKFILKLHELIQRNIDDENAGTFRRGNVKIAGSTWETPQGVVVETEIEFLMDWYNEAKKKLHPFELATLLHHKFTQIHPFYDGNGRVSRELLNFVLRRAGFPSIIIPVEARQDYFEALQAADKDDYGPLNDLFFKLLLRDNLSACFQYLQRNQEDINEELDDLDAEEKQELHNFLMWTVQTVATELGPEVFQVTNVQDILPELLGGI